MRGLTRSDLCYDEKDPLLQELIQNGNKNASIQQRDHNKIFLIHFVKEGMHDMSTHAQKLFLIHL